MALPVTKVTRPSALRRAQNGMLAPTMLVSTPGLGGGPSVRLVAPAARAWFALCAAAKAAHITLKATSAADSYRTYQQQLATFEDRYTTSVLRGRPTRRWKGVTYYQKPNTAVAARPGTSNHGFGLAVDVANASGARLDWLLANAERFGWSWETQSEAWHIRYCPGDAIPAAVLAFEEDDVSFADAVPIFKVDDQGIAQPMGNMDAAHVIGFTNAAAWAALAAAKEARAEVAALRGMVEHLVTTITADREAVAAAAGGRQLVARPADAPDDE